MQVRKKIQQLFLLLYLFCIISPTPYDLNMKLIYLVCWFIGKRGCRKSATQEGIIVDPQPSWRTKFQFMPNSVVVREMQTTSLTFGLTATLPNVNVPTTKIIFWSDHWWVAEHWWIEIISIESGQGTEKRSYTKISTITSLQPTSRRAWAKWSLASKSRFLPLQLKHFIEEIIIRCFCIDMSS